MIFSMSNICIFPKQLVQLFPIYHSVLRQKAAFLTSSTLLIRPPFADSWNECLQDKTPICFKILICQQQELTKTSITTTFRLFALNGYLNNMSSINNHLSSFTTIPFLMSFTHFTNSWCNQVLWLPQVVQKYLQEARPPIRGGNSIQRWYLLAPIGGHFSLGLQRSRMYIMCSDIYCM